MYGTILHCAPIQIIALSTNNTSIKPLISYIIVRISKNKDQVRTKAIHDTKLQTQEVD